MLYTLFNRKLFEKGHERILYRQRRGQNFTAYAGVIPILLQFYKKINANYNNHKKISSILFISIDILMITLVNKDKGVEAVYEDKNLFSFLFSKNSFFVFKKILKN